MKDSPLRIVQISDIHMFADKENDLLGVKTHESFTAVVDLLKKDKTQPSLIILSGDLSQDNSPESYKHIAEILKDMKVPVYCIPGNHDDLKIMKESYPYENISTVRHIILEHWHIILLDSQKPGAVVGHLNHTQLLFLQHCLQMYPEHHALVVFHHQPYPVGCVWLDNYVLTNADELWHILSNFPKVNTILFGHVHQENYDEKNGIKCYSVPSTCIQFKRKLDDFALEKIPPGYRWVDLYPDGAIKTGVCRVAKYIGYFDPDAKGYE